MGKEKEIFRIPEKIRIDTFADKELDKYLLQVFEHPDALEGLTAMTERPFPEFNRTYPF